MMLDKILTKMFGDESRVVVTIPSMSLKRSKTGLSSEQEKAARDFAVKRIRELREAQS